MSPSMLSPSIAVVIPWRDREELGTTLSANSAPFQENGFEVIIVNCGGDQTRLRALLPNTGLRLTVVDLVVASFNRSLALNLGSHVSKSRYLLALDADILVESRTASLLVRSASETHVITIATVRESAFTGRTNPNSHLKDIIRTEVLDFVWRDGKRTKVQVSRHRLGLQRAGSGLMLVSREMFVRVGGYNSGLIGWGFEDIDIVTRLQRVCCLRRRQIGYVTHLTHGDQVRDTAESGDIIDCNMKNLRRTVSRYGKGNFRGTLAEDVEQHKDHVSVSFL